MKRRFQKAGVAIGGIKGRPRLNRNAHSVSMFLIASPFARCLRYLNGLYITSSTSGPHTGPCPETMTLAPNERRRSIARRLPATDHHGERLSLVEDQIAREEDALLRESSIRIRISTSS